MPIITKKIKPVVSGAKRRSGNAQKKTHTPSRKSIASIYLTPHCCYRPARQHTSRSFVSGKLFFRRSLYRHSTAIGSWIVLSPSLLVGDKNSFPSDKIRADRIPSRGRTLSCRCIGSAARRVSVSLYASRPCYVLPTVPAHPS